MITWACRRRPVPSEPTDRDIDERRKHLDGTHEGVDGRERWWNDGNEGTRGVVRNLWTWWDTPKREAVETKIC